MRESPPYAINIMCYLFLQFFLLRTKYLNSIKKKMLHQEKLETLQALIRSV